MSSQGDNATLKCVLCNRTKRVGLFYKRNTKRGYSKECKSCTKKGASYQRSLDRRYRQTYGISVSEYERLLQSQGGRCGICLKLPARRRLAVDHDHQREREGSTRDSVRGLLCRNCNEYLGHIGDDPIIGKRLTDYLESPPAYGKLG